jgi:glycosyltransferase involved in cell wall biosynthesis
MSTDPAGAGAGPAVSIVLPTHNRAALLDRSIRSVLGQTYTDFELIVVDDGSTDETAGVVAGFRDPRIRYLPLARKTGAGPARNAGIRAARAKFLAFQDSDDEWLPSKLAAQVAAFARAPGGVGVVYSDMRRILSDGTETYAAAPDVTSGRLINRAIAFYQVANLGIQSTLIRRECLEDVGYFNEDLPALEDLEMFIRLSRRCAFHHLREPLVRYYETQGLSKDRYAIWASRKLILGLYSRELMTRNPFFLLKEALWVRMHRAGAEGARGAGRSREAAAG